MGTFGDPGTFQIVIRKINGNFMNLKDGSVLFPKLVHEMGIIGVFIGLGLLVVSLFIIVNIKNLKIAAHKSSFYQF